MTPAVIRRDAPTALVRRAERHAQKVIDMRAWLLRRNAQTPVERPRGVDWRDVYLEEIRRGTRRRVLMP